MPNQLLIIEPQNELKFKVDFSGLIVQGYTTYMRLTNPSNDTILFKIKTTAPKKYCVRPNSGKVDPNSNVEIAITPQPVYVDPNEKHKHKFMVQSVVAPVGKDNVDQVWKEINVDQLMDYKLKCVFETPCGTNLNDSGDNVPDNDVAKKRVGDDNKSATTKMVRGAVDGINPNEAQRKEDDSTTGSLNAKTFPKSDNADTDLQKATMEVILLREEESKLRHENLQLKEELLRVKELGGFEQRTRSHAYLPMKPSQAAPLTYMPWIVTAVGMALLGILIGKFIM